MPIIGSAEHAVYSEPFYFYIDFITLMVSEIGARDIPYELTRLREAFVQRFPTALVPAHYTLPTEPPSDSQQRARLIYWCSCDYCTNSFGIDWRRFYYFPYTDRTHPNQPILHELCDK